jgi:hypothetical protein
MLVSSESSDEPDYSNAFYMFSYAFKPYKREPITTFYLPYFLSFFCVSVSYEDF